MPDNLQYKLSQRFIQSGLFSHIDLLHLSGKTQTYMCPLKHQEALILAAVHILLRPEQRQLVLVWPSAVRAEDRAVAALIAHPVHVKDLIHLQARDLDRDIRAVRTDIRADLADGRTAQAPRVGLLRERCCQLPLLSQKHCLISCGILLLVPVKMCAGNGLCAPCCIRDGLDDRRRPPSAVTDRIDMRL